MNDEPTGSQRGARAEDRSLPDLMRQLTEQSTELARKEVELAKAELEVKARRVGIGVGAFGGAGIVLMLALGALTATFVLALATAVAGWLAALIVTVVYLAVAAVMALVGRRKVEAATPPLPEKAIQSTGRDIEEIKESAREGAER